LETIFTDWSHLALTWVKLIGSQPDVHRDLQNAIRLLWRDACRTRHVTRITEASRPISHHGANESNGNHAAREWEMAMDILGHDKVETHQLSHAELDQVSGGFLLQEVMSGLKLMGEVLSNVSKTRSEISMTFARNARA
jgi:hypothetical protein